MSAVLNEGKDEYGTLAYSPGTSSQFLGTFSSLCSRAVNTPDVFSVTEILVANTLNSSRLQLITQTIVIDKGAQHFFFFAEILDFSCKYINWGDCSFLALVFGLWVWLGAATIKQQHVPPDMGRQYRCGRE